MTTQTLTPKDSISLATRKQGDSRLLSALPALDQLVLHAKEIEHTSDDRIHQFRDRLRLAVERRTGGNDRCASFRERCHVAQMNQIVGRLARQENQFTALLKKHIRRPGHGAVE